MSSHGGSAGTSASKMRVSVSFMEFSGAVQLHLGLQGLVPAHHHVRLDRPMTRSSGVPCSDPHGIAVAQLDSLDKTVLHGHLHLASLEPGEVLGRASLKVVASDAGSTIVLGSLPLHVEVIAVPILQHG